MYTLQKIKLAVMKPVTIFVGKRLIPDTNLIKGKGTTEKISKLLGDKGIKKPLIVTDEVIFNLGLLDKMIVSLEENGIEYVLYKGVIPDPTFSIVQAAMEVCKLNNCDGVIAFGGGSTLDTAKTVAACATNGYVDPVKLAGMFKVRKQPLPFIAIPTTAGTGSEVTIVAVVSDSKTHRKITIIDPKLSASDTILDPELTAVLPGQITTTTGLDAFTHAIEAYVSGFATSMTDKMALKAIRLIADNLEKSYKEPDNLELRENLLVASMYAGQAFTRTYVGYVHAFSHNIGGKYGVAHGLGNAVLLPHVMEDAKVNAQLRFANLSDFLQLADMECTQEQKADAFVQYLFDLNRKLDIPERLTAFPESGIEDIITGAFAEAHGTYPVPKYYTKDEARKLLLKVCAQ